VRKIFYLSITTVFIFAAFAQSGSEQNKLDKLNSYKIRLINEINIKSDSLKLINRLIDEIGGRELIGQAGGGREIKVKAATLGYIKKDTDTYSAVLAEYGKGEELSVLGYKEGKLLVRKGKVTGYTLEQNILKNPDLKIFLDDLARKEEELKRDEEARIAKIEEERKARKELERRKLLISRYGQDIGEKLLKGYYWIGMTDDMAAESLGAPDSKSRSIVPGGSAEQWNYPRNSLYLHFENGVLKKYQNSK